MVWTIRRHSNLLSTKAGKCGDLKSLTPSVCDTLRSTKSESMYVSRPFYEQRLLSPGERSNMFRWEARHLSDAHINYVMREKNSNESIRNCQSLEIKPEGKPRGKFGEILFHNHEYIYIYIYIYIYTYRVTQKCIHKKNTTLYS